MADQKLRDTRVSILADPALRDYKVVGGLRHLREPQLLAQLLLPCRGPLAVESDGHRPHPGRPRVAGAAGRAPPPPHDAARRLLRGRGGRLRADRAVRRRSAAGDAGLPGEPDGMGLLPAAPRRAAPRDCSSTASPPRCSGCPEPRRPSDAPRPANTSRPGCSTSSRCGCPAMAAELAAGHTGLAEGVSLYHMLLEGVVFDAGQHALLDDLADGALPGVREGIERVERDERWHVGFGLRCLIETQPSQDVLDEPAGARRGGRRGLGRRRPRRHARAQRAQVSPTGCTSPGSGRRARGGVVARRAQGTDARRRPGTPSACRRCTRPTGHRRCRRRWRGPPADPPRAGRRPAPPADPRHGRRPPAT